uniref:(northern house mosquito) hypothetical protein n=1 Tax=Culex pipiens TaxID=7175 RepID=A0A8D8ICB8_CULPI
MDRLRRRLRRRMLRRRSRLKVEQKLGKMKVVTVAAAVAAVPVKRRRRGRRNGVGSRARGDHRARTPGRRCARCSAPSAVRWSRRTISTSISKFTIRTGPSSSVRTVRGFATSGPG